MGLGYPGTEPPRLARHFTSLMGTYTLRVDPGAYLLSLGDSAWTVDPDELELTVDSSSLTRDAVSTGGSCTTGVQQSQHAKAWWVHIDDPSLSSGAAEYDWRTSISISESQSDELTAESLREAAASPDLEGTCSLFRGAFVGYEARTFFVTESDFGTYINRVLTSRLVKGAFTILVSRSLDEHATEEQMQRALVPVRNLSEKDLDLLLHRL